MSTFEQHATSLCSGLARRSRRSTIGSFAAEVARQHIVSDLKEEDWTETDPFPQDEQEFVKIGFF